MPGEQPASTGGTTRAHPVLGAPDLDAVRESYDRVADRYVDLLNHQGMGDIRLQPWLRGALDAFADEVRGVGPVLDAGCGPGQVTAYLAERGLTVRGTDLSPAMVHHARTRHPDLRFDVAGHSELSRPDLDLPDGSLGGVLFWWSLFNLPRHEVAEVLGWAARALRPGGQVLIATHAGEGEVRRSEAYDGIAVDWTTHRWTSDALVAVLTASGLEVVADLRLSARDGAGEGLVLAARLPAGPQRGSVTA